VSVEISSSHYLIVVLSFVLLCDLFVAEHPFSMIFMETSQHHVFSVPFCEDIADVNGTSFLFTNMTESAMQDHLLEFVEEQIVVRTK
jgi:hypothetical protein